MSCKKRGRDSEENEIREKFYLEQKKLNDYFDAVLIRMIFISLVGGFIICASQTYYGVKLVAIYIMGPITVIAFLMVLLIIFKQKYLNKIMKESAASWMDLVIFLNINYVVSVKCSIF